MPADNYTLEITNPVIGSSNAALLGFSTITDISTGGRAAKLARMIAFNYALAGVGFAQRPVTYAKVHVDNGPAIALAYPTAELTVVKAAFATALGAYIPNTGTYGQIGTNPTTALLPRGSSLCVNEYTDGLSSAGTPRRGRIFLPFPGPSSIGADGLVTPGVVSDVATLYGFLFLGQPAGAWGTTPATTLPAIPTHVYKRSNQTSTPIVSAVTSRSMSLLRSRRR